MNLDVKIDHAELIVAGRESWKKEGVKNLRFSNPYHNQSLPSLAVVQPIRTMHTVDLMTQAERQVKLAAFMSNKPSQEREFLKGNAVQLAGVDEDSLEVRNWKNCRIANKLDFTCDKINDEFRLVVSKDGQAVSTIQDANPRQLINDSLAELRTQFTFPEIVQEQKKTSKLKM